MSASKTQEVGLAIDQLIATKVAESSGSDPYLWTAFMKIDGATARAVATVTDSDGKRHVSVRLEGTAALGVMPDTAEQLSDNVKPNELVWLPPQFGLFVTRLEPLPALVRMPGGTELTLEVPSLIGGTVLLFEENATSDGVRAALHAEFVERAHAAAAEIMKKFALEVDLPPGSVDPAAVGKHADLEARRVVDALDFRPKWWELLPTWAWNTLTTLNLGGVFDPDDYVGHTYFAYSQDQIAGLLGEPDNLATFEVDIATDDEAWKLRGYVQWRDAPMAVKVEPTRPSLEWRSLGGTLTSAPVIAAPPGAVEPWDVFARGGDYTIWHLSSDGATSPTWSPLGGPRSFVGPSAVRREDGSIRVFALDHGGSLLMWRLHSTGAQSFQVLDGRFTSAPATCVRAGELWIYLRGVDGELLGARLARITDGEKADFQPLGVKISTGPRPEAVTRGDRILLYAVHADEVLRWNEFDGLEPLGTWREGPDTLPGGVSVALAFEPRLFSRSADGELVEWLGKGNPLVYGGGPIASRPSVVGMGMGEGKGNSPGSVRLVARGTDDALLMAERFYQPPIR